jgi:hypothetical protein
MFTGKQAQPSYVSGYNELWIGTGIMSYNSSSEGYQHVNAKSELISQSAVVYRS